MSFVSGENKEKAALVWLAISDARTMLTRIFANSFGSSILGFKIVGLLNVLVTPDIRLVVYSVKHIDFRI